LVGRVDDDLALARSTLGEVGGGGLDAWKVGLVVWLDGWLVGWLVGLVG
jgi:hypothetical protein